MRALRRFAVGPRAANGLTSLFPEMPAWTNAVLWHGMVDIAPPASALSAELQAILDQRLAPLTLRYLRDHSVAVAAPELRLLRDSSFQWTSLSMEVTKAAVSVVADLEEHGFSVAVSKGPGIAAAYPMFSDRPFSDVDLLLHPRDFRAAAKLLRLHGWAEAEASRQPWRSFDVRCREAINLARGPGENVDLHHHIPPWLWSSGLTMAAVIAGASRVPDGRSMGLPCASVEDNLLIAALHIVSDKNKPGKTLIIWRDLAVLAAQADVDVVVRRAGETGLTGWLRAVLLALPEPVRPLELIERLAPDPPSHPVRLRALLGNRGLPLALSQFVRLPLPNGLFYLGGMVFPSQEFLGYKFGDKSFKRARWWAPRPDRTAA